MTKLRLISIASIIFVVGTLLVRLGRGDGDYTVRKMTIHKPAFAVKRLRITEGTYHSTRRGSPLMGELNMKMMKSGRKPFTQAMPPCIVTTTQDTSVLWLSFGMTNAWPYIVGLLIRPDGVTEHIPLRSGAWGRSGHLKAWALPARATNYSGWSFHLVTVPHGERLVSLDL